MNHTVLKVIADRLSTLYENWRVQDGVVVGPGTLTVKVEDRHHGGSNHLDIGFVLNRDRSDVPILWDCVAGVGATAAESLDRAVEIWARSTVPVFLELLSQDGSFAEHFHGDERDGCPNYHVIHGPVTTFPAGHHLLQAWVLQNPVLPRIGPIAASAFITPALNCVKLLFGFVTEEIAEVRINGEYHQPASDALRSLAWPRSAEAGFARLFLLFVHSELDGAKGYRLTSAPLESDLGTSMHENIAKALAFMRTSPAMQEYEIYSALLREGVDSRSAARLVEFLPLVYGRWVLANFGLQFSQTFRRCLPDGQFSEPRTFSSEPVWNAIATFARAEKESGLNDEDLFAVANRSAEVHAVSGALEAKQDLKGGTFGETQFLWPEEGPADS